MKFYLLTLLFWKNTILWWSTIKVAVLFISIFYCCYFYFEKYNIPICQWIRVEVFWNTGTRVVIPQIFLVFTFLSFFPVEFIHRKNGLISEKISRINGLLLVIICFKNDKAVGRGRTYLWFWGGRNAWFWNRLNDLLQTQYNFGSCVLEHMHKCRDTDIKIIKFPSTNIKFP